MADTFSRIGYLATWVQFQESARWHSMEAKYRAKQTKNLPAAVVVEPSV
jgi:hypothetical protein